MRAEEVRLESGVDWGEGREEGWDEEERREVCSRDVGEDDNGEEEEGEEERGEEGEEEGEVLATMRWAPPEKRGEMLERLLSPFLFLGVPATFSELFSTELSIIRDGEGGDDGGK